MKNPKFFKIIQVVQEEPTPILLNAKEWSTLAKKMEYLINEKGNFDNVHKCWLASLASIIVKIQTKNLKPKKSYTIKLKANEFFALKEMTLDISTATPFYMVTLAELIKQLDIHNR